jgi:hypothetical protein
MANKPANEMSRIAQLLLVVLSPGATENERTTAFKLFQQTVRSVDPGGHELAERIKTTPLSEEEMQQIFNAGRAQGRAEEIEQRQRSVAAIGIAASFADGDVGQGINGYSWREIVGHCVANKHRIRNTWESNFVQSVAGQLAASYYSKPTEKQAPILHRIFQTWFNGTLG